MGKRLGRWSINVTLALLPVALVLLVRLLADKLTLDNLTGSPEVLFSALVFGATTLGDLNEVTEATGWPISFRVYWYLLLVSVIVAAILYGLFLYDTIVGPGSAHLRTRLFFVGVWQTVILAIFTTLVQVMIGRIEA